MRYIHYYYIKGVGECRDHHQQTSIRIESFSGWSLHQQSESGAHQQKTDGYRIFEFLMEDENHQ